MLFYCKIKVEILFGDVNIFFLCKFYRQKVGYKMERMWSQKDERSNFIVVTAIHNLSPILVDTMLLPNNSETTFWWCFFYKTHNYNT